MSRFRTHYNYMSASIRSIIDDNFVEYVDCSVDTAMKNVENTTLQTTKPFYVDSKTPINIYDTNLLSTAYDPILQKKVASTRAQEAQAAAAAPAPSVENNVNTNVQTE